MPEAKTNGCKRVLKNALHKVSGVETRDTFFAMHSPPWVVSGLILTAAVFIPLGVLVLVASQGYKEKVISYSEHDHACTYDRRVKLSGFADPTPGQVQDHCLTTMQFTLDETFEQPVFLYYSLTSYNQNFRNLVRSLSWSQLQGEADCSCADEDACPPYTNVAGNHGSEEDYIAVYPNAIRTPLKDLTLGPCGQMAYLMFNDSYVISKNDTLICNTSDFYPNGDPFLGSFNITNALNRCEKKDIAWPGDRKTKFQPTPVRDDVFSYSGKPAVEVVTATGDKVPGGEAYLNGGYYWREFGHRMPVQEDLDFMVWMNPSSLPTGMKLLRKFSLDLPPGVYDLAVQQRYDVSNIGQKRLIIATRSWIGGDNHLLAGCLLGTGSLAGFLAITFAVLHLLKPHGGYTPTAFAQLEVSSQIG